MNRRKLPDTGYPLEVIEWVDSSGRNAHGWLNLDEMRSDKDYVCFSVGWIVYESKKRIVVAPHLVDQKDACGEMIIPKGAITRRTRIG